MAKKFYQFGPNDPVVSYVAVVGGATPTVDSNGEVDLSTLFTSANTSLMGVCRYQIAAIEPVEGVYTAADSTVNTITPSAATTIYKPSATGKARDYIVTVTQGETAYGVTFDGVFLKDFTDWPTMGANETYIFAFTEVATNSFMVAYKKVS